LKLKQEQVTQDTCGESYIAKKTQETQENNGENTGENTSTVIIENQTPEQNTDSNSQDVEITEETEQTVQELTPQPVVQQMDNNADSPTSNKEVKSCAFKVEKPKLPKFSGDVRDYVIFRADFKHVVESQYSDRDAITILRASLQGKPLELTKGIRCDYKAAWAYLVSIYGDPRFIADTITQDISKFKTLQDGEDARFCELVHLVNRSYSTLIEVGRPNDMNNNHMLALIEQKMSSDDRKVWARDPERERKEATLENIMKWMTTEMKSLEVSLIRNSVAKDLRLKGKDGDVTITKVGGEEEEIHTKLYKVSLLSLENSSVHHITAIGIPSIRDNVASVDVGKVSEKLGLEGRKLVRGNGPIDIQYLLELIMPRCIPVKQRKLKI
jgi:hypothetical protein